ncbi:MAG: deoxyribodipyrimidine photo-lyase [Parvibaculum sedimenti]|uniref:cryptochrome/photolyase family protein n=1 Tax=Parvibaculum sedimenti TaxID=2608632 RepID=UPI003BB4F726
MSVIVWFRQDLRLADNLALAAAVETGEPILPVYILDKEAMLGGASRWWLHGSLEALGGELEKRGAPLVLRRGLAADILPSLVAETKASAVFWNRCYEPTAIARDTTLKASLAASGIAAKSFNAGLLAEPCEVQTGGGGPYKVFTPFWRSLAARAPFAAPLRAPKNLRGLAGIASDDLSRWNLRPAKPDWAGGLRTAWRPGEKHAAARLSYFLDELVVGYATMRDLPAVEGTSRLSPHLHFGEISPRQVWAAADAVSRTTPEASSGVMSFLREVGWREFTHHLIYHWPEMVDHAWKPEFEDFPWAHDDALLSAWRRGRTGYPIVDAGMRELWSTGYMHNRVRMISASFLVKDLLIHWRHGAEWFEDTLVDADIANNRAGWQWVAGSGADAAPYFRIFNPVTQGEKFDADGQYIRRHVPELARLDNRYIHRPWEAPSAMLAVAGIELGATYPKPIVEHARARARALAALASIKKG